MAEIDHLVYAVPDLGVAIDDVDRRLGVRPAPGGRHLGLGTWNGLLGLRDGSRTSYLELIAADPGQDDPGAPRPFGIDDDPGPRLVTFAVRPSPGETIDELADLLRRHGHDPGPPVPMSRATPEGDVLRWRLTLPSLAGAGFVPFLIDWGDTPNPATTIGPSAGLEHIGGTPPPEVRPLLDALRPPGLDLGTGAERPLTAVLRHGDRILRL